MNPHSPWPASAARPREAGVEWLERLRRDAPPAVHLAACVDVIWDAWLEFHGQTLPGCPRGEDRPSARLTAEAIAHVAAADTAQLQEDILADALTRGLELPWADAKRAAIVGLAAQRGRPATGSPPSKAARRRILRLLRGDGSWIVRREAFEALARWSDQGPRAPTISAAVEAADDPHWRVRLAVVEAVADRSARDGGSGALAELREALARRWPEAPPPTVAGVLAHLEFLAQPPAETIPTPAVPVAENSDAGRWQDDPDPHLIAWQLQRRRRQVDDDLDSQAVVWIGHDHPRVRDEASRRLTRCTDARLLARVTALLDDPRRPGYDETLRFADRIDDDQRLPMIGAAITSERPGLLAWALTRLASDPASLDRLPAVDGLHVAISATGHSDRAVAGAAGRAVVAIMEHRDAGGGWAWLRDQLSKPQAGGLGPVALAAALTELRRLAAGAEWAGASDAATAQPQLSNTWIEIWLASQHEPLRREAALLLGHPGRRSLWRQAAAHRSVEVRICLASLLARRQDEALEVLRELRQDPHPRVRAAAMDDAWAEDLTDRPDQEASWQVVRAAWARLGRTPPQPSRLPAARPAAAVATPNVGSPIAPRTVLPDAPPVTPLGLSGHYMLPEAGFHMAVESGVGLMFFEPNYTTMIRFFAQLPPSMRSSLQVVAGTFAADPRSIVRDVDRALRLLGRERLDLFLMFWVRSWRRLSDHALEALESARAEGKITRYSLSTHSLSLAAEALRRGWSPLMVRHNAAHRRAEQTVLPLATQLGTPLILFNNTCYGRLLGPSGEGTVTAADCYRYSLAQPGVAACWTAPATLQQLSENLQAVCSPQLDQPQLDALLRRGEEVRRHDHAIARHLRDPEP